MIISDLKQGIPFGVLDAGIYTVKFQKRDLPHAHILLWLNGDHKITTTTQIDRLISSELPDPVRHPKLFRAVSTYMIHGPTLCMKDGYCTKYYPKTFSSTTIIDDSGYPSYRRRDTGVVIEKKGKYCNKSNAIKYLFKYVNKGLDRVAVRVSKEASSGENAQVIDEIKQFYDCRYLSACEAVWRTLAYDIHQRWPSVRSKGMTSTQKRVFYQEVKLCSTRYREFIATINEVAELAFDHQLRNYLRCY
ncbi:uncharacterized protein [Arachis hypogaea]|uniref:uncharacterized protein n=1 Tax=Arachis hypogaea TaxID=3818 RepID=UPI003B213C3E